MPKSKHTVDLIEAAARLKITYHLALKYVLIGRLKGQRIGRRWSVDLEDLERLEREQAECTVDAA